MKEILIGLRIKNKGDSWRYDYEGGKFPKFGDLEFNSLTNFLEHYVTKTGYKGDFKLCPLKGEIYIIKEVVGDNLIPPPSKKFNLYDEK